MKAAALPLIVACALFACQRDNSSASNGAGVATGRFDVQSKEMGGTGATATSAPAASPPGFLGDAASPGREAELSAASADHSASQAGSASDPLQNVNAATTAAPTLIIRTGQAFIEVEKVDAAILRIRQITAQFGGYITNTSVSGGRDQIRQATIEIKIPAARYEEAVGSLSSIGKVETVNSTAQDVGEEFVDVTARVNNARRLEDRLISLLANRTGKLDEVLRVERELARVREEIERYEGRLRYLGSRVATSTLTITVHEPSPILGNDPGQNPIVAALRRAWRNFVALIAGVIASLGVLIPLALVGFAGWMGYRRWRRR